MEEREENIMQNIKELIEKYCEEEGLDFREDYSGRGMFGRCCVGITCDDPLSKLIGLFAYIMDSDNELEAYEVQETLGKPKQDSMGMSCILYFPKLKTE